jgi:hypothetical protein
VSSPLRDDRDAGDSDSVPCTLLRSPADSVPVLLRLKEATLRELLAAAVTGDSQGDSEAGRGPVLRRTKEPVLRRRRRGGHRQAAAVVGRPISSYRDGDGGLPRPGPGPITLALPPRMM